MKKSLPMGAYTICRDFGQAMEWSQAERPGVARIREVEESPSNFFRVEAASENVGRRHWAPSHRVTRAMHKGL